MQHWGKCMCLWSLKDQNLLKLWILERKIPKFPNTTTIEKAKNWVLNKMAPHNPFLGMLMSLSMQLPLHYACLISFWSLQEHSSSMHAVIHIHVRIRIISTRAFERDKQGPSWSYAEILHKSVVQNVVLVL